MAWIDIESGKRPEDDAHVFIKNVKSSAVPSMAFYEKENDYFFLLHGLHAIPLIITHYMEIPE